MKNSENYRDQSRLSCNKRSQTTKQTKRAKMFEHQKNKLMNTNRQTMPLLQQNKLIELNNPLADFRCKIIIKMTCSYQNQTHKLIRQYKRQKYILAKCPRKETK